MAALVSSSRNVADQEQSPFIQLPSELRLLVYGILMPVGQLRFNLHVNYSGDAIQFTFFYTGNYGTSDMKRLPHVKRDILDSVFPTCKRMYTETNKFLFDKVTFVVTRWPRDPDSIPNFWKHLVPRIKRLEINMIWRNLLT